MYSQKAKPSAQLPSEVKCFESDVIRSSYFMPDQKTSKVVCLDSDEEVSCQSTPKPSTTSHSLLQQIENSPTKMAADQGSISNNPFSKKTNGFLSPILNRYCLDTVKSDSIFPSPIKCQDDSPKFEEPSQCESGPLIADSDEGTFRDSLFSQSSYLADDSPQEFDLSASRPNLSRFKYRRPLFSQSSGSSGTGTQDTIVIASPEKSPIIKRKRSENLSPTKRLVSK